MEIHLHNMFFSTKMLHNYIVWSSHGNITYSASIITNFNHSQKRLLHDLNNAFRYNFGLQQFFNSHVVHPENLVYTNLFYINYTGPTILYIGKFYTIFSPIIHTGRNCFNLFQISFSDCSSVNTADAHPGVSGVSKDHKFCEELKNTHCQVDHPPIME